jgi:hypothetical protein
MNIALLTFIAIALVLILLLAWAVRPPKKVHLTVDDVFNALSEKRHYARLPQILQSLRYEDTDFLYARGHDEIADRLRRQRKRIALRYLNYLEDEYQLLLEASRILARIAPEVSPMDELQRFRLNVRFLFCCRYLRWRLRFGLQPWDIFGVLSDMEGDMTLWLEAAATRIGERAAFASEFPLVLEDRRSDPQ